MDYSQYENQEFHRFSAFNLVTGFDGRAFPAHWHSYGEIILVGSGDTNIYQINQKTYHLQPGDLVLIWPTEMHEIVDADRSQALVIQFSNALIISLFASTSMSLTEIAMLSGFQSIPTFNRVFKNAKGMSPGTYRSRYVISHDTAIRAAG